MMKEKVVMLLSAPLTYDQRVKKEARSLILHGYQVKIITLSRRGYYERDEEDSQVKVETIPLNAIGHSRSAIPYLVLFNIVTFIKLISMDFDIVHCNDFDTLLAGFLAGKLRKKKIVYDSHEYYLGLARPNVPQSVVNILYVIENAISRRVNYLITVNERLANIFVKRGVNKEKISVVMNCKDPNEYQVDSMKIKNLRKKLGAENKFVILYDGWLWSHQGLEELISAIERLRDQIKDLLVVICGSGYLEKKLRKMVEEKNIATYINFVGRIPLKDIPLYVNSCDLMYLLLKKVNENDVLATPNRLFEAIVAGKPIIASNFGYMKQIIEKEGIGLLVNPEKIDELCIAILRLRYDKKLEEKIGERAESLSKAYNWLFMEKKLLNLYENL